MPELPMGVTDRSSLWADNSWRVNYTPPKRYKRISKMKYLGGTTGWMWSISATLVLGLAAGQLSAQTSSTERRGHTGASGNTSGTDVKDAETGDNNGNHIYGLEWSERSDKPCYVNVFTGKFDAAKAKLGHGDGEAQSECEEKGSSMKTINFGAPTVGAPFWAVNGVKVCLNKDQDRLKGITLYAVKIEDGKVTGSTSEKTQERTNCSVWKTAEKCPSGQIATELMFHYKDGAIQAIDFDCSDDSWK